uniref:Pentatricopeptide repeat-containing protein n=1 Tax=Ascaris lumbricoides TaxID=6252 RepID=A0A0M3IUU5_ASCLU
MDNSLVDVHLVFRNIHSLRFAEVKFAIHNSSPHALILMCASGLRSATIDAHVWTIIGEIQKQEHAVSCTHLVSNGTIGVINASCLEHAIHRFQNLVINENESSVYRMEMANIHANVVPTIDVIQSPRYVQFGSSYRIVRSLHFVGILYAS